MVEVVDVQARRCATKDLCKNAAEGNLSEVIRLLDLGTQVDGAPLDGFIPLLKAACEGHVDVVRYLIKYGSNTNTQDPTHGNTPLHEACWRGFSQTTKTLIKAKADVNIQNYCGFVPLHLACQNGHNESCRLLLLGGAMPDLKNNYGDSPLHTAARYGHAGVTRILLSANANANEVNKNGDTALHIATAMGRRKLTKMLLEAASDQTMKNKQNETCLDIAKRKCFAGVIEILLNPPSVVTADERRRREMQQSDSQAKSNCTRMDKRRIKVTDSGASSKDSVEKKKDKKKHKSEAKIDPKTREARLSNWGVDWSPYGCHTMSPSASKIADKLKTIPYKSLNSGEQYFIDLAGNVRKGPAGVGVSCFCAPLFESVQENMDKNKTDIMDHIDVAQEKLGDRITMLETETRSQLQELGNSFEKKLYEESEKCRIRSTKMEKWHELKLNDTVSEVKWWVEGRLSFHHPDSPQTFRSKSLHQIYPEFSSREAPNIKRSKSIETFTDIIQPEEVEPFYKGLYVSDYPITSSYNSRSNANTDGESSSHSPTMNSSMNESFRKEMESRKNCDLKYAPVEVGAGLDNEHSSFDTGCDCAPSHSYSRTKQALSNEQNAFKGKMYIADDRADHENLDMFELNQYFKYKSCSINGHHNGEYDNGYEKSYPQNYKKECSAEQNLPPLSRDNVGRFRGQRNK